MIREFGEDAKYTLDEWLRTVLQSNEDLEEPLDSVAPKLVVAIDNRDGEAIILVAGGPWVLDRATPTAILMSEYANGIDYPFESDGETLGEVAIDLVERRLRELDDD